jgi:hypothetical protein
MGESVPLRSITVKRAKAILQRLLTNLLYCRSVRLLKIVAFLLMGFEIPTNAQSFRIYGEPQYPFLGPGMIGIVINIENDTTNDQINSFSVSDIYSIHQPSMSRAEAFWNYTFLQNATNSYLWNLIASNTFYQTFVGTNSTQEIIVAADCPNGANIVTGILDSSVGFVNSGIFQSRPSTLIGLVGWQTGPLMAFLQPSTTNGTMQLSWTGADGDVFVDYKGCFADTNWQTFAGPFSGGIAAISVATNTNAAFFRLRLGGNELSNKP